MRILYHLPLDSGCRKIRILLAEKKLDFELKVEKVWERRASFLQLNPAGEVPVLIEADGTSIAGGGVVAEYLEEAYPEPSLLGGAPIEGSWPSTWKRPIRSRACWAARRSTGPRHGA
jgi:glutathione S-transferase